MNLEWIPDNDKPQNGREVKHMQWKGDMMRFFSGSRTSR
jgi:hypothetical protein